MLRVFTNVLTANGYAIFNDILQTLLLSFSHRGKCQGTGFQTGMTTLKGISRPKLDSLQFLGAFAKFLKKTITSFVILYSQDRTSLHMNYLM